MDMTALMQTVGLVGTGVSTFGKFEAGETEKQAYEYNAKIALEKGQYEAEQAKLQLTHLMGRQRALYAAAGVDISHGSPLVTLADTAAKGEQDIEMIEWGADVTAKQQKMYGQAAEQAGMIGSLSTFLTGLGKIYRGGGSPFATADTDVPSASYPSWAVSWEGY